jgi:hypothetical protein
MYQISEKATRMIVHVSTLSVYYAGMGFMP